MADRIRVGIVGATGSIGVQALSVIRDFPDRFEVVLLTGHTQKDLLLGFARQYQVPNVVVTGERGGVASPDMNGSCHCFYGIEGLLEVLENVTLDVLLVSVVGFAGVTPTLKALEKGISVALANKESLVVAGHLVTSLLSQHGGAIYPVDSEHSAIFQCLVGEKKESVEKIILTASGGPFRQCSLAELEKVTVEQALKHPNWEMGKKITIDSATLMNKALEVIEAYWLFQLEPHQIEVLIHPQSILHSLVQFRDGSVKAQLGLPDMRIPILYAFTRGEHWPTHWNRCDLAQIGSLTFEYPDHSRFPSLQYAYSVLESTSGMGCVLNAANEIAVEAFLNREIPFLSIYTIIEKALERFAGARGDTLEELIQLDQEVRDYAKSLVLNGHHPHSVKMGR